MLPFVTCPFRNIPTNLPCFPGGSLRKLRHSSAWPTESARPKSRLGVPRRVRFCLPFTFPPTPPVFQPLSANSGNILPLFSCLFFLLRCSKDQLHTPNLPGFPWIYEFKSAVIFALFLLVGSPLISFVFCFGIFFYIHTCWQDIFFSPPPLSRLPVKGPLNVSSAPRSQSSLVILFSSDSRSFYVWQIFFLWPHSLICCPDP